MTKGMGGPDAIWMAAVYGHVLLAAADTCPVSLYLAALGKAVSLIS